MKEWHKKFLLLSMSVLVSFLILETAVRFLSPTSANYLTRSDPYIQKIYHPNLDFYDEVEETPPNGENKKPQIKTNSLGFVGDEWEREKKGFRIANLGDSYTAGLAVDYDKNFAALLGKNLTEKLGRPVESLNFGVQKQSTAHALETYIHYVRGFDPDLVILWFDLGNDFAENLTYFKDIRSEDEKPVWKRIARKSEFLYFLIIKLDQMSWLKPIVRGTVLSEEYKLRPQEAGDAPIILRVPFTETKDNLEAIAKTRLYLKKLRDEISADEKKLLVAVFPQGFQVDKFAREALFEAYPALKAEDSEFEVEKSRKEVIKILKDLSISYVDLTPDFSHACKEKCDLYNRCTLCHFSTVGHGFTSEIVKDFILKNDFIMKQN